MQMEISGFGLADVDSLVASRVEVPGEGARILMCLATLENRRGSDGVKIVAMAEDWHVLTARVREEGLYVRSLLERWAGGSRTRYQYELTGPDGIAPDRRAQATTGLYVLDAPPDAVRSLSLESREALQASIARLVERAAAASGNSPGTPGR